MYVPYKIGLVMFMVFLSASNLIIGDIIFSKHWVHTRHVAMYVGNNWVIHAVPFKVELTFLDELEEHWAFKLLGGVDSIYRVSGASEEEREKTARYAISKLCKPWNMFALKEPSIFWSCSKLIWKSWLHGTGGKVDLNPAGIYTSAREIMDSPHVYLIAKV